MTRVDVADELVSISTLCNLEAVRLPSAVEGVDTPPRVHYHPRNAPMD